MTEQEIIKLHTELYEYLIGIHKVDASFRFRVRVNPRKERNVANGYLFNGNNDYLETSFWDKKATPHTTPIIRLVYFFKTKKWSCELVGRNSQARETYFQKMANTLDGFVRENENLPIWKKEIENQLDFLAMLHSFIKKDKKEIDKYLNQNLEEEIVDFIQEKDFVKDINKTEASRLQTGIFSNEKINFLISEYKTELSISGDKVRIKNTLPYSLSGLYVANFQGISKLSLNSDAMSHAQWIFFTGENGFGKTSILRAIALGLVGDEKDDVKTTTTIIANGYNANNFFQNTIKPKEALKDNFKLAAYGVYRFDSNSPENGTFENGKLSALFERSIKLRNIEKNLIAAFHEEKEEKNAGRTETTFSQLKKVLECVMPKLKIEIKRFEDEAVDNRWQVRYYEKDENDNIFKDEKGEDISIELGKLAIGYRSILTMIGDMIVRLSNNFKNSLNDMSGVVLIDEFDAHLHPKYQYELPKLLSEAFPKVQFIVTTHSPIPILGLPEKNEKTGEKINSVVFKVKRTAEEGITVDRLDDDINVHRLSVNAVLTSDFFGFQTIFARDATPDTIIPSNNYAEMPISQRQSLLQDRIKKLNLKPVL